MEGKINTHSRFKGIKWLKIDIFSKNKLTVLEQLIHQFQVI